MSEHHSDTATSLRADHRAILDALADGPLSANEIADKIRRVAWATWSERHGFDFEWGTDEEPLGTRLLAHWEARNEGIKLLGYELHAPLRTLERRGAVERIQVEGKRPMLWSRRV